MTSVPPSRAEAPEISRQLPQAVVPTAHGLTCLIYRREPVDEAVPDQSEAEAKRREDELDRQWRQEALLAPAPPADQSPQYVLHGMKCNQAQWDAYWAWREQQTC